jgi:antitoxin CptB
MYNTIDMCNKLEIYKKRLIYRASYRGTKEMDILLSKFVDKNINNFNLKFLQELEKFLDFEDEIISNFYYFNTIEKEIDQNKISVLFKNFKI